MFSNTLDYYVHLCTLCNVMYSSYDVYKSKVDNNINPAPFHAISASLSRSLYPCVQSSFPSSCGRGGVYQEAIAPCRQIANLPFVHIHVVLVVNSNNGGHVVRPNQ